ncbi:MAG: DUF3800 domain-containing protein [Candidatus Komeilibacteria bacterium]
MAYIFLDESGDLGFSKKKGSSRYFVIAFLFVPTSKRPIEKIIQKTSFELHRILGKKRGVLHAVKERPITRKRVLRRLIKYQCSVMVIYLDKAKVYTKLRDEKQVLYNYVTNILLDRIYSQNIVTSGQPIELIASRRETNKFFNENFQNYLRSQISRNHRSAIKVIIATPEAEKCLQVADFVCWAVFRKYERGDDSYYAIIRDLIIEERSLFG